MIDALGAVKPAETLLEQVQPAAREAMAPPQQPSAAQAADFARAASLSETVSVAPPEAGDGLSMRLAHEVDGLSAHLQALSLPGQNQDAAGNAAQSAAAPDAADLPSGKLPAGSDSGAKQKTQEAVAEIERAYMFAIETTMASRGSTETTKIFNTLLKGQ